MSEFEKNSVRFGLRLPVFRHLRPHAAGIRAILNGTKNLNRIVPDDGRSKDLDAVFL